MLLRKNISYLFTKFDYDLNLNNFETSKINFNFYKTTNDTFLKVFDPVLNEESTSLKPSNGDSLSSNLDITLSNEKFNLTTGFQAHENLSKKNNDRYQYVLPYYTFDKKLFSNSNLGSFSLNSNGNNVLDNTNQLKSQINNNLSYSSYDYISNKGIKIILILN